METGLPPTFRFQHCRVQDRLLRSSAIRIRSVVQLATPFSINSSHPTETGASRDAGSYPPTRGISCHSRPITERYRRSHGRERHDDEDDTRDRGLGYPVVPQAREYECDDDRRRGRARSREKKSTRPIHGAVSCLCARVCVCVVLRVACACVRVWVCVCVSVFSSRECAARERMRERERGDCVYVRARARARE